MAERVARGPEPMCLAVNAARLPASVLEDLRHVLESFPGEAEVVLDMRTATGRRRLRLGADYRVAPSAGLRAELDALLGGAVALA